MSTPLPDSAIPQLDIDRILTRFHAATGGARWSQIRSLREVGTMRAGGLAGLCTTVYDLRTGRFAREHRLGSMTGAGGYDGAVAWQRGPAGEIATLDAPEALRRARSQAWLDARAFWFPERHDASFEHAQTCELDGIPYHVIHVVPAGGDRLALWFASASGLLARILRSRGAESVITSLKDYREVDGLLLPFRSATDRCDAKGVSDARQRVQIELQHVVPNAPVGDGDFRIPSMPATAHIDDASGITRIPFALINHHIYADGEVDGQPVRFMVDTGGVNLLTPAAARRLGLTGEGRLAASGPGAQRADVALARARQVRLGAAILEAPVFYVVDLAQLPQAEGVPVDGLIGYEMFRRFGIEIDYAGGCLTLSEPALFVAPDGAEAFALEFERLTPIVSATLDDVPVRLTVDTGSRAALTLFAPFVREHDLAEKYAAASASVLGWGVGGAVRMRAARLGRLQLGRFAIDAIVGDLFTGTSGALAQAAHAGNLGGGVLKRFTVAFDYAARRMYLQPNTNFDLVDSFDRSGLWLLQEDASLRVFDVAPDSAAHRAGLLAGDRITAIDAVAVETHPLAYWREKLRVSAVGTAFPVRFMREDRILDLRLVLADRIPATWKPNSEP